MSYEDVVKLMVALVTFVLTIGKPLWNMSAKITSIELIVKQMQTSQTAITEQLKDHEKRITKLER